MSKKVLIIDGKTLLTGAYSESCPEELLSCKSEDEKEALYDQLEKNQKGQYIGAARIFFADILELVDKIKPTHITVVWGASRKNNIRREIYDKYKADELKLDTPLREQFGLVQAILSPLVKQFTSSKYEAIDLAGTLANRLGGDDVEINIAARNGNYLQLTSMSNVYLKTSKFSELCERFGIDEDKEPSGFFKYNEEMLHYVKDLEPHQVKAFNSIVGNPSNDIPGVKGVGAVTALPIVKMFSTMGSLYTFIENSTPNELTSLWRELGIRNPVNKLIASKENAFISERLLSINKEIYFDENEIHQTENKLTKKKVAVQLKKVGLLSPCALDREYVMNNAEGGFKSLVDEVTFGGLPIPRSVSLNIETIGVRGEEEVDDDSNINDDSMDCFVIKIPTATNVSEYENSDDSDEFDEDDYFDYVDESDYEADFEAESDVSSDIETLINQGESNIECVASFELKVYKCKSCDERFTVVGSKEVKFCMNCGARHTSSVPIDNLEETGCCLSDIERRRTLNRN